MTITPTDPRHGTNRGYNAGCHQPCCQAGHAQARKTYRTRRILENTPTLTTNGQGARRRIQALIALGYSTRQLDTLLGRQPSYTYKVLTHGGPLYLTTHREIAALYDRISMTLPDTSTHERRRIVTRNRNLARRRRYAPPLAWDDIDNDPAPQINPPLQVPFNELVDEVMVQRVLDRKPRPRQLTTAEAAEACRRLRRRGVSTVDIENIYRLKPERYDRQETAS